ncbi:hypothetical protein B0T17DRAFT_109965 [Bombardia bombarda]|uniref:Secreted protein n=1 Tax=Bombardia bombarda TaxID=252184 RepID=A0AA39XNT0_9PEZI|nr:hypothetical protein B0T17DRAFT_109965 [Bombardia bombarda]
MSILTVCVIGVIHLSQLPSSSCILLCQDALWSITIPCLLALKRGDPTSTELRAQVGNDALGVELSREKCHSGLLWLVPCLACMGETTLVCFDVSH